MLWHKMVQIVARSISYTLLNVSIDSIRLLVLVCGVLSQFYHSSIIVLLWFYYSSIIVLVQFYPQFYHSSIIYDSPQFYYSSYKTSMQQQNRTISRTQYLKAIRFNSWYYAQYQLRTTTWFLLDTISPYQLSNNTSKSSNNMGQSKNIKFSFFFLTFPFPRSSSSLFKNHRFYPTI